MILAYVVKEGIQQNIFQRRIIFRFSLHEIWKMFEPNGTNTQKNDKKDYH